MNLKAFDSRFFRICCSRLASLVNVARQRVVDLDVERQVLRFGDVSGTCARRCRAASVKVISSASTVTVPDSIFDRSRMSLMSVSRSVPAEWMFRANSTCFDARLPVGFSASCWPRIRIEFSGVRSSCDMLARNSDLYFEVSASSAAFSSSARRACSTSLFLRSTSTFCSASCCAFERQLFVGLLQLGLPRLQLDRQLLRLLQQVLGPHRRFDRVEDDADRLRELLEEREVRGGERAAATDSSMTAFVSPSKSTGSTTMFCGPRRAEARVDRACSPAAPWSAGCAASRARTGRRGPAPTCDALRTGRRRRRSRRAATAPARCRATSLSIW